VPVAVNGTVVPTVAEGFTGVTAMDFSLAAVTVNVVLPEILPEVAEIVEPPTATAEARPDVLMVAAAGVADAQVTEPVMFFVLLSE
jgi:hypothetical protein